MTREIWRLWRYCGILGIHTPIINNNGGGVCSFSSKYVCVCVSVTYTLFTLNVFLERSELSTHQRMQKETYHLVFLRTGTALTELWSNADTETHHICSETHTPTVYKNVKSSMSIWSAVHSGGSFSRRWRGSVINVCILLSKTLQSHCVQIRLELNYSSRHEPTEHRHIQMGRHV